MANLCENRPNVDRHAHHVGHEWDGIEELNTPLPRWWLWMFYLTIAWAVGYVIAYPAWPLIDRATEGVLGWSSSRANWQRKCAADGGAALPIRVRLEAHSDRTRSKQDDPAR